MGTVSLWIRSKTRRVDHGEARFMAGLLLVGSNDKHVAGKGAVPGKFVNNTDGQTPIGISSGETVLNIPFPVFEVIRHPGKKRIKVLGAVGHVDFAPPDLVFGALVPHHKLVVG